MRVFPFNAIFLCFIIPVLAQAASPDFSNVRSKVTKDLNNVNKVVGQQNKQIVKDATTLARIAACGVRWKEIFRRSTVICQKSTVKITANANGSCVMSGLCRVYAEPSKGRGKNNIVYNKVKVNFKPNIEHQSFQTCDWHPGACVFPLSR